MLRLSASPLKVLINLQRSGDRKDLLKGPVVYGVLHGAYAFFFWRNSPVGILALAILCSGDGLADIVGRRFGQSNRWEHNPAKVGGIPEAVKLPGVCQLFALHLSWSIR